MSRLVRQALPYLIYFGSPLPALAIDGLSGFPVTRGMFTDAIGFAEANPLTGFLMLVLAYLPALATLFIMVWFQRRKGRGLA